MEEKIKITVIIGSLAENSFTRKAVNVVVEEFNKFPNTVVEIINPLDFSINFPGLKKDEEKVALLQEKVREAKGVIIATPEYHGSFSSLIKLTIENLGYPSALSHKPVGLLGVASGNIGAIKSLEHLRSVCSHVGAIVLPGAVSIGEIKKYFNDKGKCTDSNISERLKQIARIMLNFITAHIVSGMSLEDLARKHS